MMTNRRKMNGTVLSKRIHHNQVVDAIDAVAAVAARKLSIVQMITGTAIFLLVFTGIIHSNRIFGGIGTDVSDTEQHQQIYRQIPQPQQQNQNQKAVYDDVLPSKSTSATTITTRPKNKSVVIVGAGAAGLTAAKRLKDYYSSQQQQQQGVGGGGGEEVEVEVVVTLLEATSVWGGRVRKDGSRTLARTFDLDLGASWIFQPSFLPIMSGMKVDVGTNSRKSNYDKEDSDKAFLRNNYPSHFIGSDPSRKLAEISYDGRTHTKKKLSSEHQLWNNFTWYDFVQKHIVDGIWNATTTSSSNATSIDSPDNDGNNKNNVQQNTVQPKMVYGCPVTSITVYNMMDPTLSNTKSNDTTLIPNQTQSPNTATTIHQRTDTVVQLTCEDGRTFSADYVIVTASVGVLPTIQFDPPLPSKVLQTTKMMNGFKVFMEFTEKIYDDYFEFYSTNEKDAVVKDGEIEFWDYGFFQRHSMKTTNNNNNRNLRHNKNMMMTMTSEPPQHILAGYYIGAPSDRLHDRVDAVLAAAAETSNAGDSSNITDDKNVRLAKAIIDEVLKDLDRAFDGAASETFTGRFGLFNWTALPYVKGTYVEDFINEGPLSVGPISSSPSSSTSSSILAANSVQIQLAGEAFAIPSSHQGYVTGASLSGKHAAEVIIDDIQSWHYRQVQEECLAAADATAAIRRHRRRIQEHQKKGTKTLDKHLVADDSQNEDFTKESLCKMKNKNSARIFTTLDLWEHGQ
jgi:hypothetical protein